MSGVFQNIDPPPPSQPSECVLSPHPRRGVHTRRAMRGVGGSIFWKTSDIGLASYSIISLRSIYSEREISRNILFQGVPLSLKTRPRRWSRGGGGEGWLFLLIFSKLRLMYPLNSALYEPSCII